MTDCVARISSCILFASLQISNRPFGAFLTGRYKSDCRLEDRRTPFPIPMNCPDPVDDKYLPCDPDLHPNHPQPQGRNSWLPPLPFQQRMPQTQSLHSSRPLLMRSQTAPTSISSVYSGPSTSSDLTICRYPSTTSSFSNLSYNSAILSLAPRTLYQCSAPELPIMPERYQRRSDHHRKKGHIPNRERSGAMMSRTAHQTQTSLQDLPTVSQEKQFWQGGSSKGILEPLRCQYAASAPSLAEIAPPTTLCTPNQRSSRAEKRKRSYESLRKGKFTTYNETFSQTGFEGSSKPPKRKNPGLIVPNEGFVTQPEPVMRRQSRTLVKKRQPWDSPPRGNRRSRI